MGNPHKAGTIEGRRSDDSENSLWIARRIVLDEDRHGRRRLRWRVRFTMYDGVVIRWLLR